MGRLSQISPFLLTGANILYRLSNVSWTPGAMAANCKPSTCFCSLSSIWCIMSMKGSRRRENSNLMIISLKAVRNPFCFLQGLQMQIRVTLLFSEMFWKLYVVCEIPISTGSCWDFPLSTGLPNISTGRNPGETPTVGLCMWVRAMETYDRVAKAGMGDGWSGNGYYFGNPHIGTYLGIHQTSSKRMVNLRGFLFSRW